MGFSHRPPQSIFENPTHGVLVRTGSSQYLRVKSFLMSWFKISKLMDKVWEKENQKSGRIVRFVFSKHFCSGQFFDDYSISGPNYLVCLIHLVLSFHAEGFTAGNFPQARVVSGHFSHCRESAAIYSPCLCQHLLYWTLIPSSKGNQNANQYFFLCFPYIEIEQKKQSYFIGIKLAGCFFQTKVSPIFRIQLCGAHSPQGQFFGMKPLSLLKENNVKSCCIKQICCPAMPLHSSISFLCFY